jgi:hypothetical protein
MSARAGLAPRTLSASWVDGPMLDEVARVRITEAGRKALREARA